VSDDKDAEDAEHDTLSGVDYPKAVAYNAKQMASGAFTPDMIVALVAAWQNGHDMAADGCCGPATQAAIETLMIDNSQPPPPKWPPFDGPLARFPKTRREVYDMFGDPGSSAVDGVWEKASIVTVRNMPGVPAKWYFEIHKLAEPYAREGLRRAQLAAALYKIARAASFVFRHQRHDPKMPLSYHSWGIAIDIDSDLNYSKTFGAGKTPEPWGPEWMKLWPKGLPKAFVEAMESVGWKWGGRWKGYVDPMHFELVGSDLPA
jgi:hypothetical protein